MSGGLSSQLAFIRHTPLRRIARRLYLTAKRRCLDRVVSRPSPPEWTGAAPSAIPTTGLSSPHGEVIQDHDGWRAVFLNDARPLGSSIDWLARADDTRAQLWRMNLHYFEYLPDLDPAAGCALIADWIDRVRPFSAAASSAAWTAYAISLRLSAWLAFRTRIADAADPNWLRNFGASIREQARYLAANLETDVRGNHLIKNIRALAECGAAFDDGEAATWRRLALRWLRKELNEQILPDGVHFERSASYHAQVFVDFLSIAQVSPDGANLLRDPLRRMAQALADLAHPDGFCAQFNDSGLNMAIRPDQALRAYAAWSGTPIADPRMAFAFPHAGLYGARTDADYVVAKMGPLGPDALMGHAHGDWGSFEWSRNGQRMIVDQGVFEYVAGDKRAASRATASHNTAQINGGDQADFFGAFRCAARPRPPAAAFEATATGFGLTGRLTPAKGGAPQRRRFEFSNGALRISDDTEDKTARIDARLLLHPDIAIEAAGDNSMTVRLPDGTEMAARLIKGDTLRTAPAEWWPDMGRASPTTRVTASGRGDVIVEIGPA